MKKSSKIAAGFLAAASVAGVVALANSAAATDEVQAPLQHQATVDGGAVDLNGNPVESKMVVSDTPPSDLGELQFSGSATAGDEPQTGTFSE